MIVDELMGALEQYEARRLVVAVVEGRLFDIVKVVDGEQQLRLELSSLEDEVPDAPDRTRRIAELNDRLRLTGHGGRVMMTRGVLSLGDEIVSEIIAAVRAHDEFTEADDPHHERDFGAVEARGRRIFFKIDYYDASYIYRSEDPADPELTRRVMTIMLAEEY